MNQLHASAGSVDLAPPPGLWMSGYAARIFPATGTHDPIAARAVLLDDGSKQIAIVSSDLIGFDAPIVADIRRRISARCGIPAGNIIVACTHTHSGPAPVSFRGVLGKVDQAWLESVKVKVVDLVSSLPPRLQPAAVRYASTNVPNIAFNRQDSSREIDDEATIIGIDSLSGDAIATILNFGCHAVVLGGDNLLYSADYPGAAVRRLESIRGGVGMFLQGTFGDVNPAGYYDRGLGGFDTLERIGTALADAAGSVLGREECNSQVTLGIASAIVDTPLEAPPSLDELSTLETQYRAQMAEFARNGNRINELIMDAFLDWVANVRSVLAAGPAPTSIPAEISVVRINDLLLVTTPFELYSDIGKQIKEALKPHKVAYVGCANDQLGYLATEWAKDQGGYGPGEAYKWFVSMVTAIDRKAGGILVQKAASLAGMLG